MSVPGALPRQKTWKNNRKRSLYVEEGFAGFIFYRKSKTICEGRGEGPSASEQPSVDPEPAASIDPVVIDDREEEEVEEELEENDTSPLSDKQLANLIEVKSLVDQLKKEIKMKGNCSSDSKLEEVCSSVLTEMRRNVLSGSEAYIQYLEATEEEDKLPPHPMDGQLMESIRQLQQMVDLCKRETREWEDVMEKRKNEAQATMQDLENDMKVKLSQLGPEDEAKLASHLSAEQRRWLDTATRRRRDQEWERQTEQVLSSVRCHIDGELERIRKYCDTVLHRCSEEADQLGLEVELPTQTPRTLFRALKDTTN